MNNPGSSVEAIFEAARAWTGAARAAYLERACGSDASLRARVEALLLAHDRAGAGFLDAPPALEPGTGSAGEAPECPTAPVAPAESAGTVIGHYRLLQAIGEGGFGTVFMAEQERPVRRKVALKIIKLGMDTRQVVARFEQERQALAVMDHPSIAKVFDAGATETGRPYFVMELVRGEPITAYCDKNSLSIEERLALFEEVCGAVQHAHTKGIIHRDLKPSNVLVGTHDGRAHAKVIDFGIAKATDHRLTEKTFFTEFKQFMGTPEYMSPEQAEGSLDIDTRTDVYSLGVLLYELLTGATPFDGKRLRSAAYAEIQRIIREEEPAKPSTRLSASIQTLASVAAARRVEPRRLGALVRGELDWIVMKALEKDRSRRYETATGLAADVRRYLAAEPVSAAPPSAAYRLRKFVRRHRVGVMAGAVVAAALVAGAGAAGTGLVVALRARDAAERNAQAATKQAARSERVARVLTDTLAAAGPRVAQGRDATILREIMDQTSASLAADLKDYPDIEAEIRTLLGATYRDIEAHQEAKVEMERAIALCRSLGPAGEAGLADALEKLAHLHLLRAEWREAQAATDEAFALDKRLFGEMSRAAADNLDFQAQIARGLGDTALTERLLTRALEVKRAVLPPGDVGIGFTLTNLGLHYSYRAEFQIALPYFEEAVAIARRDTPEGGVELAATLSNYGNALRGMGRLEDAKAALEEALTMHRRYVGEKSTDAAIDLSKLATVLEDSKDYEGAERCYRESMDIVLERFGPDHQYMSFLSNNMGLMLMKKGDFPGAEPWLRRAHTLGVAAMGADHPAVAQAEMNLGRAMLQQGRAGEAADIFRRALGVFLAKEGEGAARVQTARISLARALLAQAGDSDATTAAVMLEEAAALAADAYAQFEKASWLSDATRAGPLHETAVDLAAIFDRRHAIEPGHGHDAAAEQWRVRAASSGSPGEPDASATPAPPPP